MLNSEQARERLKTFTREDGQERRIERLQALAQPLGATGCALLGRLSDGKVPDDWDQRQELKKSGFERFHTLGAAERMLVFEAIFPKMAPCVERAWQLLARLPYQRGWHRKSFRSPGREDLLRPTREHWLDQLIQGTDCYEQDVTWFAQWVAYINYFQQTCALLFAAAIEAGGEEGEAVYEILVASMRGEHEIGAMGRHVTGALLIAPKPEGWKLVEGLLLAAQRQEGLRQVVLEAVDEAHPQAFRRMVRLILDHDLLRFSATVRAVDVWFGFNWEASGGRGLAKTLERVLQLLDDPRAREEALEGEDPEDLYLALWAIAFEDVEAAFRAAVTRLAANEVERRYVVVHFLALLDTDEAQLALLPLLGDPDLRVTARAFQSLNHNELLAKTDFFDRLERLAERLPRKQVELGALVWPWTATQLDPELVADRLGMVLGERPPLRLVPHLPRMSTYGRGRVVDLIQGLAEWKAEYRDTVFALVGDPSSWVRERALRLLDRHVPDEGEVQKLEALLTRKSADLRRAVLTLLLKLPDDMALASADRLLGCRQPLQRLAGLELLQQLQANGRFKDECRERARRYQQEHSNPGGAEQPLIEALVAEAKQVPATLEDGLGLFDPARLTPRLVPAVGHLPFVSDAALRCIESLDAFIHAHRDTEITIKTWQGQQELLLGNLDNYFPAPTPKSETEQDWPLFALWRQWQAERPALDRDGDGLELLRAVCFFTTRDQGTLPEPHARFIEPLKALVGPANPVLHHPRTVYRILQWLLRDEATPAHAQLLLDFFESVCATALQIRASLPVVPEDVEDVESEMGPVEWYLTHFVSEWVDEMRLLRSLWHPVWEAAMDVRFWQLLRTVDGWEEWLGPQIEELMVAYRTGAAREEDVFYQLIGTSKGAKRTRFTELHQLSGRKPTPLIETFPELGGFIDRCRERILEVELVRGELPTAASGAASRLRTLGGGSPVLLRILRVLGKESFVRGWSDSLSRAGVFCSFLRGTFPGSDDTPEEVARQLTQAQIPEQRLIELAFFAPQWSACVELALGWPGFAEGVWWVHAHTRDTAWQVQQEIRETWAAQVSERTPLSANTLLDGAVDVAWFLQVHTALGAERWEKLYDCARYASGGSGHKRAQLFADAMLGRTCVQALRERIRDRRNQDAVRALGLVPLEGPGDVLERYQLLQEFVRGSRKFGSQRQASEKLAATIGLENLARTAGYPDPQRLEWAMEAQAVADLAENPQVLTLGEVELQLAIDTGGEPQLTVSRKGKPLKAVPAACRKDPRVVELQERKQQIKQQASRMRASLERSMIQGDQFTGEELTRLFAHPVMRPMLGKLVFTSSLGTGFPSLGGRVLLSHDGTGTSVTEATDLRIAHPHDLLTSGQWHLFQRSCFQEGRTQPFKQVFRELYTITQAEAGNASRRYCGHQVNPRQALALFGSRGWVSCPEEGVRRTFHAENLSVWVSFAGGYFTPAEVEGLTIDEVYFTRRGEWQPVPMSEVPPRLFSEVMRDLDLVVSVAHRGGVDPEASASTVEMRSALVQETCRLLKLDNVRLQKTHALVAGKLAHYSIHLGSATVHRQPGGSLCIVPVHAQHRGRLFLPFVDDDPRSAEVLSKVVLLARDQEIQDPTILEQILRG